MTPYEPMRHAAAAAMARAGVRSHVIDARLRYTRASFTYDNYGHARPENLAEARNSLNRMAA